FREPSAPPPAPPKKSRKGVVIAAVAGLAIVGGIVAFVATREDKPERTRDAVIKQTFAALASGDENALFELADPTKMFTKIARCEKLRVDEGDDVDRDLRRTISREQADYRDPEKIEARWKKDLKLLLRRTKGTKLEVVDILTEMPPPPGTKPKKSKADDDDDDRSERDRERDRDRDRDRGRDDDEDRPEHDKEFKLTTYRKGQEVMRGCYARVPFRRQQVKVSVDVKEGDREFSQRVKITLQEIDGEWYLSFPPALNVGFDVVLTDLQAWRDKTCKCTDAGCVEDLEDEVGRLAFAQYDLDREADLPKEFLTRVEKVQSERRVCEATARGGPELAKYKELKNQVCACKDDECSRKLEVEMAELRRQVEASSRRSRSPSYEVTRQLSDLALQASDCTRKLAMMKVRVSSSYPSSGELTGGTFVTIRGVNFTSTPRTAKVTFGTKEATTVRFVSDNEMLVEVPPAEVEGFVDVRVQFDPGGLAIVPYGFTYRAPLKPIKKPKPKTF
ncbi:MAG: IPT/TIG domain-containing protein, partial [Deltaproteobacteria bacterium]|nr:IPT/TIG domain-containing protein [Deltaproteobacteria bacterium]